jgi:hypothetical protein
MASENRHGCGAGVAGLSLLVAEIGKGRDCGGRVSGGTEHDQVNGGSSSHCYSADVNADYRSERMKHDGSPTSR